LKSSKKISCANSPTKFQSSHASKSRRTNRSKKEKKNVISNCFLKDGIKKIKKLYKTHQKSEIKSPKKRKGKRNGERGRRKVKNEISVKRN
jgi:hypothetical protein